MTHTVSVEILSTAFCSVPKFKYEIIIKIVGIFICTSVQ